MIDTNKRAGASQPFRLTDIDSFRREHNGRVAVAVADRNRRIASRRVQYQLVTTDQPLVSKNLLTNSQTFQNLLTRFRVGELSKSFKAIAFRIEIGRLKIEFSSVKGKSL